MTKAELAKLDQIWSSLYGNGKPGLKTDVEILKQKVDSLLGWGKALFIIVTGSVVGILVGILTHTIKL